MKTWFTSPLFPLLVVAGWLMAVLPCRALVISFDDAGAFASDFPTITKSGDSSSASVQPAGSPDHLALLAEATTTSSTSQASIYSAAGYSSDLDFITSAKTFVFTGAALTFGAGSYEQGDFGVVNASVGGLQNNSGPADGIFLQIDRNNSELSLVERVDKGNTTLQSWGITDNVYSFTSLSLTLSATGWSVSGESTSGGTVVSSSGTLTTAFGSSNWGTDFYLGMQALQNTSSTTRYSQLSMTGIAVNAVPEPGATAMILGGAGLLFGLLYRKRF